MISDLENRDFASLVKDGRVHRSIYLDPAVFAAEMRRIFERTWVYVGHESEIADPGEYKVTSIGTRPVILVRDWGGMFHVLLNQCSHRGATVCQRPRGRAT